MFPDTFVAGAAHPDRYTALKSARGPDENHPVEFCIGTTFMATTRRNR